MLKRLSIVLAVLISVGFMLGGSSEAGIDPPHNDLTCSNCHSGGWDKAMFSPVANCVNCHSGTGHGKPFAVNDASYLFNYSAALAAYTTSSGARKQVSHAWGVTTEEPRAGASRSGISKDIKAVSERTIYRGKVGCSSCHYLHAKLHPKFLRTPQESIGSGGYYRYGVNEPCVECHSARSVTTANSTDSGKQKSHPIRIQYGNVTGYYQEPQIDSAYAGISTSVLKLFSTVYDATANPGGGSKTVMCMTCHGIHAADSNPYTYDILTTAGFGNLSSGDGYLLRRYNDSTMCKDCHNFQDHGKTGNSVTCRNCHNPHSVGNNMNLIMLNISTPLINNNTFGNVSVFKTYTTRGYVTDDRNGSGICEACHSLRTDSPSGNPVFRRWSSNHSGRTDANGNPIIVSQASNYNCMNCHPHQTGTGVKSFLPGAAACSQCHGQPPQKNYTGTTVEGGYAWFATTGKGYNDTTIFLNESSTPHKKHAVEYDFGNKGSGYGTGAGDGKCRACHNNPDTFHQQTSFADTNFQNVNFGLHSTAGQTGSYNQGTRVCSNLYCHSNSDPWDGTAVYNMAYSNPTWGDNISVTKNPNPATCNSCHLYPPATNAHAKHTDSPYYKDCAYCHNNTVTNYSTITASGKSTYHVNRDKDVFFGTLNGTAIGGSYDSSAHKCMNVYCHGNDPSMNNYTVAWDGTSACGTCHDVPQTSSSHSKHVGTYGFDCANCHEKTMDDTSNNTIANYTTHVDGIKSVDFGVAARGSETIDNTGGSFTQGSDTCADIYCHSEGNRFSNYSAPKASPATWGASYGCNGCHGGLTGMTTAMPSYGSGSPKENSHFKHVIDNGFVCNVCHDVTIDTGLTIGNYSTHVNGRYDIDILSAYGASASYNSVTKKCSNVKCHGLNDTPVWGTSANCTDCHYSTISDVDDFVFQSFSGTAAKIYSSDWATVGHGRTGTSYPNSGNPPAGKTCTNCHRASVSHGDAGNPFRLYTAPDRPNVLCKTCHGTGGSASKNGIFEHASSVTQTGRHDFELKCIDCHDPHGDNNIFMIHSTVYRPDAGNPPVSDQYGVPAISNGTEVNVDFTNNAVAGDYAKKNTNPGICQVCHDETYDPQVGSSQLRFNHNTSIDKDHGASKCPDCHSHKEGFKGAGCWSCHGFPPTNDATNGFTLLSGQDTSVKKNASGSTTAGAHKKHTDVLGATWDTCDACHDGGMATTQAEDGRLTIEFDAFTQYSTGKYTGQSVVRSGYYGYSGQGITTGDTLTCQSVKCHGGGGWLTFGNDTTPVWNDPSTAVCGSCHGAKKAPGVGVGAGAYPDTNAHAKHAGFAAGEYDFMCKKCHDATLSNDSTFKTAPYIHVNAEAKVQFDATDSRLDDPSASYGGDLAVNSGFGACTNTYCHSRAHSTTQPYSSPNVSLAWDGSASCNSCHGSNSYTGYTAAVPNYASGSPKVNSHIQHVVNSGIKCYACHYDTTTDGTSIADTTKHVNKSYDIKVPAAFDAAQDNAYASNSCSSVDCHDNKATPAWGGSAACEDCHYTSGDTDDFTFSSFSGVVAKVYSSQWTTRGHGRPAASGAYPYSGNNAANKTCSACHDSTVKHNASGNYFRLKSDTGGDSVVLCLGCHGSGSEITKSWSVLGTVTGIQNHTYANLSTAGFNNLTTWHFTPKCIDCHDPHGDTNIFMIHTKVSDEGSDVDGVVPVNFPNNSTVVFIKLTGVDSYDDNSGTGRLCVVCHERTAHNGDDGGSHSNAGKECRNCHDHTQGFNPSGCNGCHNYPPPDSPSTWTSDKTATPASVGLHTPHAFNGTTGMPLGNDVDGGRGYKCVKCHGPGSNGQPSDHDGNKDSASMINLTSSGGVGATWTPNAIGKTSVVDDTCSNVSCHTPRSYERTWAKPSGCDSCHGYQNVTSLVYNLQTEGSHVTHINYTSAGADTKKYGLECTQCHVNNQNNYTTHYTSKVDIDFSGGIASGGSPAYSRGTAFDGATTGGEYGTCSDVYCHGGSSFINGTTANVPQWGGTLTGCFNCHKDNSVENFMPERHPKHAGSAVGNYNFQCQKCHDLTVTGDSTIKNYSAHVNGTKDVKFDAVSPDNSGGTFDSAQRQCQNLYCHSNGTDLAAPYAATAVANYTADWDVTASGRTGGKPCSFCHGNKVYSGYTAAMPNYASGSPKPNSHVAHVVNNGIQCKVCHASTTADNVSISNTVVHVNGFYNVSVINTYVSASPFTYNTGTGVCSNVKCHGGNDTPAWGSTASCPDCHFSTSDVDDFVFGSFSGTAAAISQAQWTSVGHGRDSGTTYPKSGNAGAAQTCTANCHSAGVSHGDTNNPFRLANNPTDTVAFCKVCHTTSIEPHDTASTDGRYNFNMKCVDCHDPHGDDNIFMVHSTIYTPDSALHAYSSSDRYGTPFTDLSARNVDFKNNALPDDYKDESAVDGIPKICNVCHTRTGQAVADDPRYQRDQSADGPATHNPTELCTNCHKHSAGFEGGGESGGGSACGGCHGALFRTMTGASSYHHYMQNAEAVYSDATTLTTTDTRRRCLMCHVDHNIFSPGVPGLQLGRAMNLRQTSQAQTNYSGINTDFWPALSTGKYSGTNPIEGGVTGANGVCIGCHHKEQLKNTTNRGAGDGSTKARGFSKFMFYSSSHNFQVIPAMSLFSSTENPNGGSGTSFRANCSKCHGSYAFNKAVQDNAREKFGIHDTKYQSLNRPLNNITSKPNPLGKNLCYNCHGKGVRASYDYYSSVEMNSGAKMIQSAIEAKTSGHPAGQYAGHDPAEYYDAKVGWLGASGPGENRHVECMDCHNTHGGNARLVRDVGSPDGNRIAGAQKGAWGVMTSGNFPAAGGTVRYQKKEQIDYQYELCAKCHSFFAWSSVQGSMAPSQGTGFASYSVYLTDVMREFNPNNYGYHPVVKQGKNQPLIGANPYWPDGGSGAGSGQNIKYYDPFRGITSTEWVEGLSYAMIPPWTKDDTLGCTDCHQADSTGKAVSGATYAATVSAGTWTNEGNIVELDGVMAVSQGDGSLFKFDVGNAAYNSVDSYAFAVWGYTGGKNKTLSFNTYSSGVQIAGASGSVTLPKDTTGKATAAITLGISDSASMNSNVEVEIADDGATVTYVDKVAIEATYTMTEALRGPHGSMMQWILASANPGIMVDWNGNGVFDNTTSPDAIAERPNASIVAGTPEEKTFCFNCHRRDVYSGTLSASTTNPGQRFSRFNHNQVQSGGGPTSMNDADLADNKWGIPCMTCHGGGRTGAIHGDWEEAFESWSYAGGTGDLARPVSARLLNGAGAHLEDDFNTSGTRGLNCYVNGGTPLSSCSTSHTPKNIPFTDAYNYDYTDY